MTPPRLASPFARRMAPLALVAGVVVGVVLPATYQFLTLSENAREAAVWARDIAEQLEGLGRARPSLWTYDEVGLSAITYPLLGPPVSARVRVDVPGLARAFAAGPQDREGEVSGWAVVRVDGRAAGRVEVGLEAASTRSAARRLWIGASVGGVLLALGLFYLPLRTVRRGDDKNMELWSALEAANATLEARVEARTAELRGRELELRELGARLVAVQEEERARISRDLHDDLGQTLTALRLRLTALSALGDRRGDVREEIGLAIAIVDAGVEQVRRLAHNLRPAALDGLGLRDALGAHADRWSSASGVEVERVFEDGDPAPEITEVVFRVAQEALTNVARHADADKVRIELGPFDDGWRLVVEDDGRGLDGAPRSTTGGLGLVGVRERIEQAGGYLDIETGEWGGVRLTAWLPEEDA